MRRICDPHNQVIGYIGWDKTGKQLKGYCPTCVPDANTRTNLLSVIDVLKNIETNKNVMLDNLEESKELNILALNSLIEYLGFYKLDFIQKIDVLIQTIQQSITELGKEISVISTEINKYETFDVNQLVDFYELKLAESGKEQIKTNIHVLLVELASSNFFFQCMSLLGEFPSVKQIDFTAYQNDKLKKASIIMKCDDHEGDILGIDLNPAQNITRRHYCFECSLDMKRSTVPIKVVQKLWENHVAKMIELYQGYQKQLFTSISRVQEQIWKNYEKIKQGSEKIIIELEELKQQKQKFLQKQIKQIKQTQFDFSLNSDIQKLINIKNLAGEYEKAVQEYFTKLESQLSDKENLSSIQIKRLFGIASHLQKLLMSEGKNLGSLEYKTFNYRLLDQSIKQNDNCYVLAINQQSTILAAGCGEIIKIFQFKSGKIIEQQQLEGHSGGIQCLQFMRKQNKLVSASYDKVIKIWILDQKKGWITNQNLQVHKGQIHCLIINYYDDLIISGGSDKYIIFWGIFNNQWKNQQILQTHTDEVYGLSLNESETVLASCGKDKLIIIMGCNQNKEWIVNQKIITEFFGYRICFINDNQFGFQQTLSEYLDIYNYNATQRKFIKGKDVPIKKNEERKDMQLFPIQFSKTKRILISKNGQYINVIQKEENGEFKIEQSIGFNSYSIYGTLSSDGEYLITWDQGSWEIQVRQIADQKEMILTEQNEFTL